MDQYSGAGAAYSLRQLSSTSTNAIRVERDSDNTQSDIGFVDGELDVSTLSSFCGGGDCKVVTIYDQSGNGYDVVSQNETALIYESGALITANSLPIIQMTGDLFQSSTVDIADLINSNQTYISTVGSWGTLGSFESAGIVAVFGSGFALGLDQYNFGSYSVEGSSNGGSIVATYNAQISGVHAVEYVWNAATSTFIYVDGVDETDSSTPGTFTPASYSIYIQNPFAPQQVDFQEVVIWPSNQISNRSSINSNVMTYWGL